LYNFLCY